MLRLHCAKGSSIVVGFNGIVDFFILPENLFQEVHFMIIEQEYLNMDDQY